MPSPDVTAARLDESLAVVYRSDSRKMREFSPTMDELATRLSLTLGKALLIRYDSRVGHRSAEYFRGGRLERSFGEKDELYVEVDEQGLPMASSPLYTPEQLDPTLEYETKKNAIELGLEDFGTGDWESIMDFVASIR
jgi:hypothetical protein